MSALCTGAGGGGGVTAVNKAVQASGLPGLTKSNLCGPLKGTKDNRLRSVL